MNCRRYAYMHIYIYIYCMFVCVYACVYTYMCMYAYRLQFIVAGSPAAKGVVTHIRVDEVLVVLPGAAAARFCARKCEAFRYDEIREETVDQSHSKQRNGKDKNYFGGGKEVCCEHLLAQLLDCATGARKRGRALRKHWHFQCD